jgi:hypothetical protein
METGGDKGLVRHYLCQCRRMSPHGRFAQARVVAGLSPLSPRLARFWWEIERHLIPDVNYFEL